MAIIPHEDLFQLALSHAKEAQAHAERHPMVLAEVVGEPHPQANTMPVDIAKLLSEK